MIKEKHFSAKHDFHTGIVSKSCFFLSILFFVFAIIETVFNFVIFLDSSVFLALGILFIGIAGISWFFNKQFSKLSDIVEEMEQEECEE
jgi:hypothetical protein